ncbi:DUF7504 family protein [Haloferax larsenii]|uniref:RecA-superfamily ATPase, KaiC/GvpD/RAD55 family n=1 Tax=Haloferax larsenii TaxID=302484 RepID=A0A1H7PF72_HALLR|nr:hypothetical protein [Haloferax larsenii]SEL34393.1 hypothetical protein SAMN04488691_10476 [Haloferax larsenii]
MSISSEETFATGSLPLDPIQKGTSILLTGEDADALESVFYKLSAPQADERGVIVSTDESGRSTLRSLDRVSRGSKSRSSVLAAAGSGRDDSVETISDLSDLTMLGMTLSSVLAESQQLEPRFRCGIYLCSTICREVEDVRSVYRLLNSNFLSELRRGDGLGVCAIDTSADIGANMQSIVAGMKTSFKVHIDVEKTGSREATLSISGLADSDDSVTVAL